MDCSRVLLSVLLLTFLATTQAQLDAAGEIADIADVADFEVPDTGGFAENIADGGLDGEEIVDAGLENEVDDLMEKAKSVESLLKQLKEIEKEEKKETVSKYDKKYLESIDTPDDMVRDIQKEKEKVEHMVQKLEKLKEEMYGTGDTDTDTSMGKADQQNQAERHEVRNSPEDGCLGVGYSCGTITILVLGAVLGLIITSFMLCLGIKKSRMSSRAGKTAGIPRRQRRADCRAVSVSSPTPLHTGPNSDRVDLIDAQQT